MSECASLRPLLEGLIATYEDTTDTGQTPRETETKRDRERERERRVGEWVGGIECGERSCRRGEIRVGSAVERQFVINGILLLLLYPHA